MCLGLQVAHHTCVRTPHEQVEGEHDDCGEIRKHKGDAYWGGVESCHEYVFLFACSRYSCVRRC